MLLKMKLLSNEKLVTSDKLIKENLELLCHSELGSEDNTYNSLVTSCSLLVTKAAFTMAEILLSLTIIGVVAAITLPSLTGNINERTWNTQRKALYARMSQAIALMPALNGYGSTDENAAETFISSGLSKVLKINNICGYGTDGSTLHDCGFASQFINGANVKTDLPKELGSLNTGMMQTNSFVSLRNTKAAAFETANGESILTFYNPNCMAESVLKPAHDYDNTTQGFLMKHYVCANFFYDLNGKKGPNTIGKDIGVMLVAYATDSKVVMPIQPKALTGAKSQSNGAKACGELEGGEYRLPNIEEVLALYYNVNIMGDLWAAYTIWSSSSINATRGWAMMKDGGIKYDIAKDSTLGITCVKRN